jgi:8-oxo-dGTP pyrophosphatase MutT (NUDIX family)
MKPWEVTERHESYCGPIFTLEQRRVRRAGSEVAHAFDVLVCPDWVNVVALTPEGRVLLIRQWRVGSGRFTLEIPGGSVDPGETPLAAARRELQEETGYTAETWEPLGVVEPNPAFQTNFAHTFLARGARRAGPAHPDENEEIELLEAELADVPGMLRDGRITHALVHSAFLHLAARGGLALGPGR